MAAGGLAAPATDRVNPARVASSRPNKSRVYTLSITSRISSDTRLATMTDDRAFELLKVGDHLEW